MTWLRWNLIFKRTHITESHTRVAVVYCIFIVKTSEYVYIFPKYSTSHAIELISQFRRKKKNKQQDGAQGG